MSGSEECCERQERRERAAKLPTSGRAERPLPGSPNGSDYGRLGLATARPPLRRASAFISNTSGSGQAASGHLQTWACVWQRSAAGRHASLRAVDLKGGHQQVSGVDPCPVEGSKVGLVDRCYKDGPPRFRPSVQEMASPLTIPAICLPRLRSSTGRQGTSVNSRLFSTSA